MQTTTRKRLLSLLLVLTMLLSLCPAAFAAGDAGEVIVEEPAAEEILEESAGEVLTEESETEDEAEKAALPYGLPGMPEGFVLTEEELARKASLRESGLLEELDTLLPGVDYLEGEILYSSRTEEAARTVAEAYDAELLSFSYGIAVAQLRTLTVPEALRLAADESVPLPAVDLNAIVALEPEPEESEQPPLLMAKRGASAPTPADWAVWRDYYGEKLDPYLRSPGDERYQYMHDVVHSYPIWSITRGASVKVGVVDSGVGTHEDLPKLMAQKDFSGGSSSVEVGGDHATHVAGIIGAALGNGLGGAGIAPEVELYSYRSLDSATGMGSAANTARAIRAATEDGMNLINLSLGGPLFAGVQYEAIREAIANGITVCASMGNSGTNIHNYPGSYNIDGLIACGALARNGRRASYSNYGPWQSTTAPGSDIQSTVCSNQYGMMSGTSMSTPVVTGVCALYLSYFGKTSPAEMEKRIRAATAEDGSVDLLKLFEADTDAPALSVTGYDEKAETAPYGAELRLVGKTDGELLLYTLDGTLPLIRDGAITNGTVCEGPVSLTKENGFAPGTSAEIVAVRVNALGIMSKPVRLRVTVQDPAQESVRILNAPQKLAAGTSYLLKAELLPAANGQRVSWSITAREGCPGAKLDAKTGRLQTGAKDAGRITVEARSPKGASASALIEIAAVQPAKKLTFRLDGQAVSGTQKLGLTHDESGRALFVLGKGKQSAVLPLTLEAFDSKGAPLGEVQVSWSFATDKVLTLNDRGEIVPVAGGLTVVTATALDGGGATARLSFQLEQLTERLVVTGPSFCAPGKSAALQAEVLPAGAGTLLTWSVDAQAAAQGVKVSASGRVTLPAKLDPARCPTVTVTAAARDGSGASGSLTLRVCRPATKLAIGSDPAFDPTSFALSELIVREKDQSLRKLVLYSVRPGITSLADKVCTRYPLAALTDADARAIVWTSSNEKAVRVSPTGEVTAVAAGTSVITAQANDGSGKKASVTVQVINPVSGITIRSSVSLAGAFGDEVGFLTPGKTAYNTPVFQETYGRPGITDVSWSYTVTAYHRDGDAIREVAQEVLDRGLIVLNTEGRLSIDAGLKQYTGNYRFVVAVTATSTDGTGLSGEFSYLVQTPTSQVGLSREILENQPGFDPNALHYNLDLNKLNYVERLTLNAPNEASTTHALLSVGDGYLPARYCDYSVESDKPDIAGGAAKHVFMTIDGKRVYSHNELEVWTNSTGKKGTAVLTIKALDGSGAKCELIVNVK